MSNNKYYESDLEIATLQMFDEIDYQTIDDGSFNPGEEYQERNTYSDVLLESRLKDAIRTINKHLPNECLDDAFRAVKLLDKTNLIENNKQFHNYLIDGIDVQFKNKDGITRHEKAYLVDFDNPDRNDFLVVNQFTVIENRTEKRPDVVVFVNGLPLVLFELKSISEEEATISNAYNQIKNYQTKIPSLFEYNVFSVISDGLHAKAGTLTSNEERFMSWRTIDGDCVEPNIIPALEVLIKGMFDKRKLLDIIKNFVLFQEDGSNTYKILAAYHQYHAVNKALESTISATSEVGDRRIGVVWHTQGSGKSLSMVFYAGKLVVKPELQNPTIIVITDRNDLDDQLYGTFSKSIQLLRSMPKQAESVHHLRELLNGRESGGIIFTTIHKFKFDEKPDVLTSRKNIIVIADEAHRTQYGFSAKVVSNEEGAREVYGLAKYMRDSLPNASFIGFTGTPIENADKNTPAVFGDYIDTYDLTQAVEDGATVKIFYESRIIELELDEKEKNIIDYDYEEITEYQEQDQKENLKRKWAQLEKVVGSKPRIQTVSKDLVEHFEKRLDSMETEVGKGMIVAMSRRIAVELYNQITTIRPDWHSNDLDKGKIKVVMTGTSSDPIEWHKHQLSKKDKDMLARRMRSTDDELMMVIVVDMWLTGFDVPSLHTMYIDKPIKGHNLMQAIARVNRVFKEKQGGLIVDYIGIANNLKEALQVYTDTDRETAGVNTDQAAEVMLEKLDLIHDILHGHDYSMYFEENSKAKLAAIVGTIDYVIGLRKERKDDYINNVNELSKAYSLCATTEQAEEYNLEIGFHKAVRAGIIKMTADGSKKKTIAQLDAEMNQLISKSLKSAEVIDVLAEAGLNRPDISILSDEFLEEFKHAKKKNLAVEMLNRLIKGKIRAFSRKSLVKTSKFSELLEETLRRYQNRSIETTQIILELIELAKDITKAEEQSKQSGLSEDEFAFYEALSSNELAVQEMGGGTLRDIAIELAIQIKDSKTVDWKIRESVRATMRRKIKILLKQFGYPPDNPSDPSNYDKSVKMIMDQSVLICDEEAQYAS